MYAKDVELGYLAHPEGAVPVPGVVLIHDVWGMAEHPRDLARRLAAEGFAALAEALDTPPEEPRSPTSVKPEPTVS